jgi:hypothetical protein
MAVQQQIGLVLLGFAVLMMNAKHKFWYFGQVHYFMLKWSTLKLPTVTVGLLALLTNGLAKEKRSSLSCHSIRDKAP